MMNILKEIELETKHLWAEHKKIVIAVGVVIIVVAIVI
tara:strand:- start:676 stop:789 length:114 start_codon:yes stop_codon:yes gene_type:complete